MMVTEMVLGDQGVEYGAYRRFRNEIYSLTKGLSKERLMTEAEAEIGWDVMESYWGVRHDVWAPDGVSTHPDDVPNLLFLTTREEEAVRKLADLRDRGKTARAMGISRNGVSFLLGNARRRANGEMAPSQRQAMYDAVTQIGFPIFIAQGEVRILSGIEEALGSGFYTATEVTAIHLVAEHGSVVEAAKRWPYFTSSLEHAQILIGNHLRKARSRKAIGHPAQQRWRERAYG